MPVLSGTGRLSAPLLLSLFLPNAGQAEAPALSLPLDCSFGVDCYIQQYVDRDAGPGRVDYRCGRLAKDGHKGTDFAVPSLSHMERGIAVLAAGPGIVRRIRDGMPDIDASGPMAPKLTDRECGNGVAIDHGQGWESQYCHLRRNSVAVRPGDRVEAGTRLGAVGMSGLASFPHLHFSVRNGDRVIDPFRPDMSEACGPDATKGLWKQPLAYRPAGLIAVGIIDRVPEFGEIREGLPEIVLPDRSPEALVVWGYAFAGQTGDVIRLSLEGPGGRIGSDDGIVEKDQPFLFRAWGQRAPRQGFPPGDYRGTISHLRDGKVLDRRAIDFRLR